MFQKKLLESLAWSIEFEEIGQDVIDKLMIDGGLPAFESMFWDYKSSLAVPDDTKEKNFYYSEIIKDIVSFYNAFGGYIIFGATDNGTIIPGAGIDEIDIGDLKKRIKGATGEDIEISSFFAQVKKQKIFCLSIGKRPATHAPLSFIKAGPPHPINGKKAYKARDTYLRFNDECKPAANEADNWKLLHSDRIWDQEDAEKLPKLELDTNLPGRLSGLSHFVGRKNELATLRRWMGDARSPIKVLTGIGGLGKTALAYKFCEELLSLENARTERLFWLSAKAESYSSIRGELVPTGKRDYTDEASLFSGLMSLLGTSVESLDGSVSDDEENDAIGEALSVYKTFLVIDDLDSLEIETQRAVLHRLNNIFTYSTNESGKLSRLLVTTRTDQALAPSLIMKLEGIDSKEYEPFVKNCCNALSMGLPNSRSIKKLRRTTVGSPLFTESILRLVKQGVNLESACNKWEGADGEDVRAFAFAREIDTLSRQSARVLYAICILEKTSLIELGSIVELSDAQIRDCISELQSFHLAASDFDKNNDIFLSVSDDVRQTKNVLRKKIAIDAPAIDQSCAKARASADRIYSLVAIGITQIKRYLEEGDGLRALDAAKSLTMQNPSSADAACMLGCVHAETGQGTMKDSDFWFQRAFEQGCRRPELQDRWPQVKKDLEDWMGLRVIVSSMPWTSTMRHETINLYIESIDNSIKIMSVRNDNAKKKTILIDAIEFLSRNLTRVKFSNDQFQTIIGALRKFSRLYFSAVKEDTIRDRDAIDLFKAAMFLDSKRMATDENVLDGANGLTRWVKAVVKQDKISLQEYRMGRKGCSDLRQIMDGISKTKPILSKKLQYLADTADENLKEKGKEFFAVRMT
ncbi:MAG: RNA-binding domain-containing protein [Pseudomonadota bacterium]